LSDTSSANEREHKLAHTFRVSWDIDTKRLVFWYDGAVFYPDKLNMTVEPDADGIPTVSVSVENRFGPIAHVYQADKTSHYGMRAGETIRSFLDEYGIEE
jgi:hypothetical protein